MLHNCDRFGHFDIRVGDTARFPLAMQHLGNPERNYPQTWEVIAFGQGHRAHLVCVQRRHDGITRWLANHWFDAHADPFLRGGRDYQRSLLRDRAAWTAAELAARQRRHARKERRP